MTNTIRNTYVVIFLSASMMVEVVIPDIRISSSLSHTYRIFVMHGFLVSSWVIVPEIVSK